MDCRGKVVLFGAGATGRGHVGLLCWQAGYSLVLVDRDPNLVNQLRHEGSYSVHLYSGENLSDSPGEVIVDGYKAYFSMAKSSLKGSRESGPFKNCGLLTAARRTVASGTAGHRLLGRGGADAHDLDFKGQ